LRRDVKNQRTKKAVRPMATECLSESVPMCENKYFEKQEKGKKEGGNEGMRTENLA